jgi:hypothetical protein
MKQRIRAEAHGSSPSCRHRAPVDTDEMSDEMSDKAEAEADANADSAAPCEDRT